MLNVSPQMKPLHISASGCFAIAMTFYLLAWVPSLVGFSVSGLFFEVAARVKMFSRKEAQREGKAHRLLAGCESQR